MNLDAVRVRLLGPVEVTKNGVSCPISGLRRKSVLAVLALHPGEIVSTSRLIDLVWGDDPPATAPNTLQRHISYLRGALQTHSAILSCAPGYVLNLAAEAVDAIRAIRLVGQGHRAEDHARNAAKLRAALELWRGPSLADVKDVSWLNDQARRLDELRLDAVERLVESRLALGEHTELVPELEDLAAQYPFREHVHELLMLALYRSARQADALAAYQRLRRTLDGELGIGPGSALRDLEMAILRQDPILERQSQTISLTPAASVWVAPAQLPRSLPAFTGRTAEINQLDSLLAVAADGSAAQGSNVVLLSGTAGVGKTALAVHWAHHAKWRFPDGQLYVNLHGFDPGNAINDPANAVRLILEALGVPMDRIPATAEAQASLYRSVLAGKRVLIVADNARDEVQVRPLLPGTPGCLVVVTSRNRLLGLIAADGAHSLFLDLPTAAEARQMFAARLGAQRVADERGTIDEIVTRCGRLPLALAVVAATAVSHPGVPLAQCAVRLREATVLESFDNADLATDVRAVFSSSYRMLSEPSARLFRLMGICPGQDFALPAVASAAGMRQKDVLPLLAELTQAQLLVEANPGRFKFHELLRAFAMEQSQSYDDEEQRTAARQRFFDYYLHTATRAGQLLRPARHSIDLPQAVAGVMRERLVDRSDALTWFTREYSVLLAIMGRQVDDFDRHTWQLAQALLGFLSIRGYWRDNALAQEAGLMAAQRLRDQSGQAYAHRSLSRALILLGRLEEAEHHNQVAMLLSQQLGSKLAVAEVELIFAAIAERRGDLMQALDRAEYAYRIYQTADQLPGQAHAANAAGWYYALLGNYHTGLGLCEDALAIFTKIDDVEGLAGTWDSLGVLHSGLGDAQNGADCFHKAILLYRTLGYRFCEAECFTNLGDCYQRDGNVDAAEYAWRQALELLDELEPDAGIQVRARLAREPQVGSTMSTCRNAAPSTSDE